MVPRITHLLDGLNAVLALGASLLMGSWLRAYLRLRAAERRALDDPAYVRNLVERLSPFPAFGADTDWPGDVIDGVDTRPYADRLAAGIDPWGLDDRDYD